ncbi:MAG: hypothetical protein QXU18_07995 [Thermoplasmatales archaeon]
MQQHTRSKTFGMIVENTTENATLIYDRGYNSEKNVNLIQDRRYNGALTQSDHRDLMALPLDKNSVMEAEKNVYRRKHRIVIYHRSGCEKKRIIRFMRAGDSDSLGKARYYLESRNMNETIILPDLSINSEKMKERFSMFGKNVPCTNIHDMKPNELIDLYMKRNRVEYCFRVISMRDLAFLVYHWTLQKIKVHILFSYLAYLFLALMRMKIKPIMDLCLLSVTDILSTIKVIYIVGGKSIEKRLFSADERARKVMDKIDLIHVS